MKKLYFLSLSFFWTLYLKECSELVHELEDISKLYKGNAHESTKYHEEYGVDIFILNNDKCELQLININVSNKLKHYYLRVVNNMSNHKVDGDYQHYYRDHCGALTNRLTVNQSNTELL
jgi:hypothetical protein